MCFLLRALSVNVVVVAVGLSVFLLGTGWVVVLSVFVVLCVAIGYHTLCYCCFVIMVVILVVVVFVVLTLWLPLSQ